jgi:hypothetical protein
MKETWHFEPAAGLYAPVFRGEDQPRGFVDSDLADLVCDLNWNRNDRKGSLDTEMKDAMAIADAAVTSIRKGEIDHDPYRCSCHFEHASVPDPRLHPSAGIEPGEASP